MECKNVCSIHKNIFVNKSKNLILGKDVYFCKACNIFIKFKEILTNFINTIFHKQLKKLRCACCSTKLRVKTQRRKLKENRLKIKKCECGCGEFIKPIGVRGTEVRVKMGHGPVKPRIEMINRYCLFCNSKKTALNTNKSKTPKWFRYENGFICQSCFTRWKYQQKKIANLKIFCL